MGTALQRNARDASVSEKYPSANYSENIRMYINGGGSTDTRYIYLFFSRPFPLGATILSAKLRLWNGNTWTGTGTTHLRMLSGKWSVNRVNWNNKPGVTGADVQLAKTAPADKTMWEYDIASFMQSVSNGQAWYGFRLAIDENVAGRYFMSTQGPEDYRPQLEISWSDAPDAPSQLAPSGNRSVGIADPKLVFDFTDVSGDTDMQACQVQINSTDVWTAPAWDSGVVATSVPELDLTGTTYPGLADGSSTYWRVRVQDGAGVWSAWSDAAQFKRTSKGTLTITNPPAASPNAVVRDSTPPITWTFTGRTQKHYQVAVALASAPNKWLWDSGKITSGQQSLTIPAKVVTNGTDLYRLIVRVWDDISREKVPDDDIFVQTTSDFQYIYDLSVNPVSSLAMTPQSPYPWAKLTWQRSAGVPDFFDIWRDGEIVASHIPGTQLFTSGTSYEYIDLYVAGRTDHTWKVVPIVNGVSADNNPTTTGRTLSIAPWLMDDDTSNPICLLNPEVDASRIGQQSERFDPVGIGVAPILVSQSRDNRFEGHVTGRLANDIVGITAAEQRRRFTALTKYPGDVLIFFNLDQAMNVVVYNATYRPVASEGGSTEYIVDFDFFQVD